LWLCGWLLAAGFATWHAVAVDRYLDRVTTTRFAAEELMTPLQRVPQAIAPDGQMWIRYAIQLAESGKWRLRSTDIDNAPDGRSIYWNSGWALWLEACGRVRTMFTGQSLPAAIEDASLWANLPLFLVVMTLASVWTWRRWNGMAGGLMALAMIGCREFYAGFYPAYADHHGLISACVLGVVLGAVFAGGGTWRSGKAVSGVVLLPKSEHEVMNAVTISAVCGAVGLWISAASLVVTLAFTGVMVLVTGLRRTEEGLVSVPNAWRRWGRIGAGLSICFYLLENFPDRLGMRMEANHPLYALAWWGAGEVVSAVLLWRLESRTAKWLMVRLAGWGTLVLVAPLVVLMRGVAVFGPLDPFLARVHESIHEFQPFLTELKRVGWGSYRDQILIMVGLMILASGWWLRKPVDRERRVVLLSMGVTLAAITLGFYQNRWLLTAGAPQIVLAVLLVTSLSIRARNWLGAAVPVVFVIVLLAQGPWTLAKERLLVERVRDVQLGEAVQLLYRDIAGGLRRAGADEKSIVLADPNASVGAGYYGRLRTVGTLYWENRDGLLAAAEILNAHDDADAAAQIYARGITHVVMVSSYDFLPEYNYALHGGAGPSEDRDALGHRLLYQHRVPVWLRPINYRVPAPLVSLGFKVAVFAVDFTTPREVSFERIGRYQLSKGERGLAEASFMTAMTADPSRPEPWFRMGELALSAGRMTEALNFVTAGIERTPESERDRLIANAAELFRRQGSEGVKQAESLLGLLKR
jgi:hypothetical protein